MFLYPFIHISPSCIFLYSYILCSNYPYSLILNIPMFLYPFIHIFHPEYSCVLMFQLSIFLIHILNIPMFLYSYYPYSLILNIPMFLYPFIFFLPEYSYVSISFYPYFFFLNIPMFLCSFYPLSLFP